MATAEFFMGFLVAGAVGGLIGLEREHRADKATVIAGVRTFPLVSLAGYLLGFLAIVGGSEWLLPAGVLGAFGFALMFIHMRVGLGQTGITTPIALIVTFLLGAVIAYGHTFEAVVVGVAVTFLLLTKQRLHRFAQVLDDDEILSALQFITILFILLPLTASMPRGVLGYDWLGRGALVDPFAILLVVVFVSSISFASLLVMRRMGPGRGMEFSGLLGGLVNSEATTAALAHRARDAPSLLAPAVAGAVLASTTMVFRNLAIAGFADPTLRVFASLLPYVAPVAVVGLFAAWRSHAGEGAGVPALRVRNPFAILPALRFALVYAAVSLLVSLARTHLGEGGVYIAAIGGFLSAGAVVASLTTLAATGAVDFDAAVHTCLLAIAASVAGKLAILRAIDRAAYLRARGAFVLMALAAIGGAVASFVLG